MDPLFIAFGLVVGVLVGLTGIGGGSLMTPLLILAGGVPPAMAIGTDLAYGAVTKTVGGWRHLRIGTVDLGVSKWLAFGSVPGSVVGVWLTHQLKRWIGGDFDGVLLVGVAVALSIVSLAILYRVLFDPGAADRERHTVVLSPWVKTQAVLIGAVMGLVLLLRSSREADRVKRAQASSRSPGCTADSPTT